MVEKTEFDIALPYLGKKLRSHFAKYVLAPLKVAGVDIKNPDAQLTIWEATYSVMRLRMSITAYAQLPTLKKLKRYDEKFHNLLNEIVDEKSAISDYLINLSSELMLAIYNVDKMIELKKQKPTADHTYPPGIKQITKSLEVFWNDHVKKEKYKITGYGFKDDVAPRKTFDMQTNPGEYYLQNNLKHFFGYSYTNTQIRTLMSMIKDYPIEHARSITKGDYTWWEKDPVWSEDADLIRKEKFEVPNPNAVEYLKSANKKKK